MSLKEKKVLQLVHKIGVLRPRDLDAYEIPREYLSRLHRKGRLEHTRRGLYIIPNMKITEHHNIVESCKMIPHGVICLISALQFHGLTTQNPLQIWMAIDYKARRPKAHGLSLRIVRFSEQALYEGIERHKIEKVEVKIYNPAKTIADCFKYRNKIGLDVALEALREGWREGRFSMDEIWEYAKMCRVSNVLRPYLESLV